jgi:hypothetical protein
MTEFLVRIGDRYELVLAEGTYKVWPSGMREGQPLAQFRADADGQSHALRYFGYLEANPISNPARVEGETVTGGWVRPSLEGQPSPAGAAEIGESESAPMVAAETLAFPSSPVSPPVTPGNDYSVMLGNPAMSSIRHGSDGKHPLAMHLWAALGVLALLVAASGGVVYALTRNSAVPVSLAGCNSIQLVTNVSPPLYPGTQVTYSATTQCGARVSMRLVPTGNNPTPQSASSWSKVTAGYLQSPNWNEDTTGDAPGTYHFLAEMRVLGRKRMITSQVVTFTILLKPFDTGNPPNNDAALTSQLQNASSCESINGRLISVAGCEAVSLRVLNAARAGEGLPAMTLPSNFWSMPYDEQQFILVNEERVARNLPPIPGLTAQADGFAAAGAAGHTDPTGPSSADGWAANWAGGVNTVADDFLYMYDDGYATDINGVGGNVDCVPGNTSGCWGHRENILQQWNTSSYAGDTIQMGAACVPWNQSGFPGLSCAMIFIATSNPQPYIYTWADALAAGA